MTRKLLSAGLALLGLVTLVQLVAAQAPPGTCCPDACPEKVCKSVAVPKTVTERKYTDVCEDVCLPRCSFFGFFTGHCDSCADGKCGVVKTKKYLVIHFRKHEECVNKCVVEYVAPACAAPCYDPAPVMAPPMTTPSAPLPLPK